MPAATVGDQLAVTVPLAPRWAGHDGYFGGYVAGLMVDVTRQFSEFRIASLTANFVSRIRLDELQVEVTRVHRGRSTELVRLAVRQEGRVRVHGTAELLGGRDTADRDWIRTTVPQPPPSTTAGLGRPALPFDDLAEIRTLAEPDVAIEARNWVRWRRPPVGPDLATDQGLLAAALDLPAPGLLGGPTPAAFVPSVEYTVHFGPHQPGAVRDWMRLDHATAWVSGDHCVDEVQAWSAAGTLLATLRQTRGIREYETTGGAS